MSDHKKVTYDPDALKGFSDTVNGQAGRTHTSGIVHLLSKAGTHIDQAATVDLGDTDTAGAEATADCQSAITAITDFNDAYTAGYQDLKDGHQTLTRQVTGLAGSADDIRTQYDKAADGVNISKQKVDDAVGNALAVSQAAPANSASPADTSTSSASAGGKTTAGASAAQ